MCILKSWPLVKNYNMLYELNEVRKANGKLICHMVVELMSL